MTGLIRQLAGEAEEHEMSQSREPVSVSLTYLLKSCFSDGTNISGRIVLEEFYLLQYNAA
jgi:hypothetical protein